MLGALGEPSALLLPKRLLVRRAERRSAMATATKQARTPRQRDHQTVGMIPSEFLVFQNNGGDYHWAIVSVDGATLAQSGAFASFDDAERAAGRVRDGAASARFELRSTEER